MGDQLLNFEASGALMDASLVMRDRETDSWWSIMTSDAIGGDLDGADLVELPAGEKVTWKKWREQYPDTLVLSVDGEEHVENNPYDNYFASDDTFRGLEVDDDRLEPKDPIYSFWFDSKPFAVPHDSYRGGRLFEVEELGGKSLLLYRSMEGPMFESSRAYLVSADLGSAHDPEKLLAMVDAGGRDGIERLPGFDTFWYNWVAVNEDTRLIR